MPSSIGSKPSIVLTRNLLVHSIPVVLRPSALFLKDKRILAIQLDLEEDEIVGTDVRRSFFYAVVCRISSNVVAISSNGSRWQWLDGDARHRTLKIPSKPPLKLPNLAE